MYFVQTRSKEEYVFIYVVQCEISQNVGTLILIVDNLNVRCLKLNNRTSCR